MSLHLNIRIGYGDSHVKEAIEAGAGDRIETAAEVLVASQDYMIQNPASILRGVDPAIQDVLKKCLHGATYGIPPSELETIFKGSLVVRETLATMPLREQKANKPFVFAALIQYAIMGNLGGEICGRAREALGKYAVPRFIEITKIARVFRIERKAFDVVSKFVLALNSLSYLLKAAPSGVKIQFPIESLDDPLFVNQEEGGVITRILKPEIPAAKSVLLRFYPEYRRARSEPMTPERLLQLKSTIQEISVFLKNRTLIPEVRAQLQSLLFEFQWMILAKEVVEQVGNLWIFIRSLPDRLKEVPISNSHELFSPFLAKLSSHFETHSVEESEAIKTMTTMRFGKTLQAFLLAFNGSLQRRNGSIAKIESVVEHSLSQLQELEKMQAIRSEIKATFYNYFNFMLGRSAEEAFHLYSPKPYPACKKDERRKDVAQAVSIMHFLTGSRKFQAVAASNRRVFAPVAVEAAPSAGAGAGAEGVPCAGAGAGREEDSSGAGAGSSGGAEVPEEVTGALDAPYAETKAYEEILRNQHIEGRAAPTSMEVSSVMLWQTDPDAAVKAWRKRNPSSSSDTTWLKAVHNFEGAHATIAKLITSRYALEWQVDEPDPGCEYFAIAANKVMPGRGDCDGFIQIIVRDGKIFHMVFQPEKASDEVYNALTNRAPFKNKDFPPLEGAGESVSVEGAQSSVEVDGMGMLNFPRGLQIYLPPQGVRSIGYGRA
ncbi:MAG: hypothetical protein MRY21_04500 [Simkaniaceae bacterium]|nr:hypothetical protein [Simkaniaceae bacterium]